MQKISVITINWNNATGLKKTLRSVEKQSLRPFEYIVVDGGSSDGSKDLISEYTHVIDKAISERDNGIYDAMAKGADLADGEWLWFLNAGDIFADGASYSAMATIDAGAAAIVYGDYLTRYADGYVRHSKARSIDSIWKGMPSSHQAFLVKRSSVVELGFRSQDGFAADYGQISRILSAGKSAMRVPNCTVLVEAGGISDIRRLSATILQSRISLEYERSVRALFYWSWQFLSQVARLLVKRCLPIGVVGKTRQILGSLRHRQSSLKS